MHGVNLYTYMYICAVLYHSLSPFRTESEARSFELRICTWTKGRDASRWWRWWCGQTSVCHETTYARATRIYIWRTSIWLGGVYDAEICGCFRCVCVCVVGCAKRCITYWRIAWDLLSPRRESESVPHKYIYISAHHTTPCRPSSYVWTLNSVSLNINVFDIANIRAAGWGGGEGGWCVCVCLYADKMKCLN